MPITLNGPIQCFLHHGVGTMACGVTHTLNLCHLQSLDDPTTPSKVATRVLSMLWSTGTEAATHDHSSPTSRPARTCPPLVHVEEVRDPTTVHPQYRQFLWFAVGDQHFQYRALPFGISTAPRVLTKMMVVVIAHLRTQSASLLREHIQVILALLHTLGLQVNTSKSNLHSSHHLQFIGAITDTSISRAFIPQTEQRLSPAQPSGLTKPQR